MKEWPLWEVFIRSQHGLAHKHASFNVHGFELRNREHCFANKNVRSRHHTVESPKRPRSGEKLFKVT